MPAGQYVVQGLGRRFLKAANPRRQCRRACKERKDEPDASKKEGARRCRRRGPHPHSEERSRGVAQSAGRRRTISREARVHDVTNTPEHSRQCAPRCRMEHISNECAAPWPGQRPGYSQSGAATIATTTAKFQNQNSHTTPTSAARATCLRETGQKIAPLPMISPITYANRTDCRCDRRERSGWRREPGKLGRFRPPRHTSSRGDPPPGRRGQSATLGIRRSTRTASVWVADGPTGAG